MITFDHGITKIQKITAFLIFFGAIVVSVIVFPDQREFRYEYQKGKMWQHDDLVAPFDFVVLKSSDDLKIERDSAIKQAKPYFNYLSHVWPNQSLKFEQEFDHRYNTAIDAIKLRYSVRTMPDSIKTVVKKYARNQLSYIYSKGVSGYNEVLEKGGPEQLLVIVNENVAETHPVSEIFNVKQVQQYLKNKVNVDFAGRPRIAFLIDNLKLTDFIEPNLEFNKATSTKIKQVIIGNISPSFGMVSAGELIIAKGEVVNDGKYMILESLRKEYQESDSTTSSILWLLIGQFLIITTAFSMVFMFLFNFRREILANPQKLSFIIGMMVLMVSVISLMTRLNIGNIYAIPFVMLPILIQAFYDGRLAFFVHMATITLCGLLVPNGFEFVLLQFIAGAVSMFSLSKIYKRGQLFAAMVIIISSYIITYTALSLLQEGDFRLINYHVYYWFILNGILLLICYPLIFILEKAFGFLSEVTLLELSDTNHPLLRQLAEKAPGTFQHVMQVANLAEDAIRRIDGNALLMRVGALYHDIGKTNAPQFFIENQHGKNPHDALSYEQSAGIIIDHVHYGIALARKYKLPQQIIDFITTHHGTGYVKYFYTKYVNENNNRVPDLSRFTYPGPPPFTKETAVLMMADAVEASSRTLKEYSPQTIDELVERIISTKITDGQFIDADITFREISIVKEAFKQKLLNIYHGRIEYPEAKAIEY
jgi:cyclic-di-AMP phosphodiesterase PgpH